MVIYTLLQPFRCLEILLYHDSYSSLVSFARRMSVERTGLPKNAALLKVGPWYAGAPQAYILAPSSTYFASTPSDYPRTYLTYHLVLLIVYKHDSEQLGAAQTH
jgi:hypothetical protein